MSYSIELLDAVTNKVIELDFVHHMQGGTYKVGGTTNAKLNITYNYSKFYTSFGKEGIRELYGKTGAESIKILKDVIDKLGNDVSDDYWKATEGNAKIALTQLLALAQMRPDGIWVGD